ncbi:MAG TPA: bifunctional hydroxymethylpyrimidine kinase/phosphomethylpyrimidine kinase [Candidatus Bathyarchaeia archaeon]|nr:bifunctional hydroxymethylpyrimidine kinase/phosphomethylpyrimidine kinase [Candidatus Bathyarchaeia archaeon]
MLSVMTVAGSDSGGGAGVSADTRTLAALGVHGTPVITAVTSQNTLGVRDVYNVPAEVIVSQIEAIISDIDVRSAKIGMLGTHEIAEAVADALSGHRIPIVVDPVLAAEAGGRLLKGELNDVLSPLMRKTTVLTPNIQEAEAISGATIHTLDDMKQAAREINTLGPQSVIVTGGHLGGTDVLYDGRFHLLRGKLIKGGTHGAGCTFSAALAVFLAKGYPVKPSASMAKTFVSEAIRNSERIGAGPAAVNQFRATLRKAERYLTLLNVEAGLRTIKALNPNLIPEIGSNLAMAITDAKHFADVAAVKGRIAVVGESVTPVGCVAFGASRHMGTIVLAALSQQRDAKAAMNLRYSDDVKRACEELNLVTECFGGGTEPDASSTVKSRVAHAIETSLARGSGMPNLICDWRVAGTGPTAFVFGHSAQQVADMAARISSALG